MALNIMPTADELLVISKNVTKDINLSLKQCGSIPAILSSSPWTINYLSQLRLLAFSEAAQRVVLRHPDNKKFQFLEYSDLSPAIIQVVGHATDAFQLADTNMSLVETEARLLFGKQGPAGDILSALQQLNGGQDAIAAMGDLKEGIRSCSSRIEDVKSAFGLVVSISRELELSMTKGSADAQKELDQAVLNQREKEVEVKIEEDQLEHYRKQIQKEETKLHKAEKDFRKIAKHSELKALGVKTLVDVQGLFSGALGGAINALKEAPNIAITGLNAVGNLGNVFSGGDRDSTTSQSPKVETKARFSHAASAADPGLQAASEIDSHLSQLQGILDGDLVADLQNGTMDELKGCVKRMEATRDALSSSGSQYSQLGFAILKDGVKYGRQILSIQIEASSLDPESHDWEKRLNTWRNGCERLHEQVLQLRGVAVAQAGQGFGNTTSASIHDLNGVSLASILKDRQEKVFMMETAMHNAEDNVRRLTRKNKDTQTKMIKLAHRMKELDHSRATIEETKQTLAEAINIVADLQTRFGELQRTFDMIAGIIEIRIDRSLTRKLDRSLRSQIQARTVIDTVLQIRGHFMFIYDMSKLYSQISRDYFMPCIQHMSILKVGKVTPQEQEKAKAYLEDFTIQCSDSINKIAVQELEQFQMDIHQRCQELQEETLQHAPALQITASERAIIKSAGHAASNEVYLQEEAKVEEFQQKMEQSSKTMLDDGCFD